MSLPFRVLLLALRPLSKTADISDWKDIIQAVVVAGGYGGGGIVIQQLVALDWIKISYFAFVPALLLFIAAFKLQKKADDYDSRIPCIVFQKGEVATGAIYEQRQFVPIDQEANRSKLIGDNLYLVYVFVKNDPTDYRGEERTAKKAVAIIEVYVLSDIHKPLLSFWGHWRDKPQVITRPRHMPFTDLAELDLPPNGMPHRIDFAIKYRDDNEMYGYNDHAQRYSPDGRFDEYKLPYGEFFVKIRLKAVGMRVEPSEWYKITHGGAQTKPIIMQLSEKEMKSLKKLTPDKGDSQTE